MAIPFYEPRQQQHANECDQIDGNFPPAPSSQSLALPTACSNIISSIVEPTSGTVEPPLVVSGSAEYTNPTSTALPASASTADGTSNTAATSTTFAASPSQVVTNSSTGSAIFSFSTNQPAANASLSTQTTSTEFITAAASATATPISSADPLPWKLLAVSMCKALKQYYQQNGSNSAFTTAVIEILPSGVRAAQE